MNQKLLDFTIKYDSGGNSEFWGDVGESVADGIPGFFVFLMVMVGIITIVIVSGIVSGMRSNKKNQNEMCKGKLIEKIPRVQSYELNKMVFEIQGTRMELKLFNDDIFNNSQIGDIGVITYKGEYMFNFEIIN